MPPTVEFEWTLAARRCTRHPTGVERSPFASRAVLSAGYDPATRTLELEFAGGRVYSYMEVSQATYEWLLRAHSKGAFVTRLINERYAYRDITPGRPTATENLAQALRASLRSIDE